MSDNTLPGVAADTAWRPISIGRVTWQCLRIFFRHLPWFALLSPIFWLPSYFAFPFIIEIGDSLGVTRLSDTLSGLFDAVLDGVMKSFVIVAVFGILDTGRPGGLDSLRRGAVFVAPMVLLSLLLIIIYLVGFILLVIPGLILMTIYAMAPAVLIREERSLLDCMARSADLSRGYRWKIFALILGQWIFAFGLAFCIGMVIIVGATIANGDFSDAYIELITDHPVTIAVSVAVSGAITNLIFAILYTVLYDHILEAKEGVSKHKLAAVFE